MSSQKRHLTVIMFTDIVGYTKLMGSDEQMALITLKLNRDIHKRIIKKHNGRWLKEMGDGTLSSYQTISDAVYCAGALIHACNKKDIDLRIGIHLGDVVEDDGDIFGDGVNVASRLEQTASPNQVLVSAPIHRDIKNKDRIQSTFIEEKQLKNVDEPVRIYSVEVTESGEKQDDYSTATKRTKPILSRQMLIGLIAVLIIVLGISYFFNPLGEGESTTDAVENISIKKSIAVLPFKDMSQEQDQEYLGDGIAEDIINRLTKVNDLKVIGRTSSFSFKDKDTDLKNIGEMLGVETILEGSVQKSGKQLRITAQLINAEDGSHIWSEQFNREFSDVFSLQDELAQLVVSKMLDVPALENKVIYTSESLNSEAYEYYLKGKYLNHSVFAWSLNSEDFKQSEKMFLKSLEISPNYDLAHAGLANLYNTYTNVYGENNSSYHKYFDLQKKHIEKAYNLNPNSDYVNSSKGLVHLAYEEYDSSFNCYLKSIQLNAKDLDNILNLTYFLNQAGLYYKALNLLSKIKKIEPINRGMLFQSGRINHDIGRLDIALTDFNSLIFLEPNKPIPYARKSLILIQKNDLEEAEIIFNKFKDMITEAPFDYSFIESILYAKKNDKKNALNVTEDVPSLSYSLLGMKEDYVKTLIKENSNDNISYSNYLILIHSEGYDWVKDDPRIQELVINEKKKYEMLNAKYGNLDFLDL